MTDIVVQGFNLGDRKRIIIAQGFNLGNFENNKTFSLVLSFE